MTEEHRIQNQIRLALSPYCTLFRTNAGDFFQGHMVYSREYKQNVLIHIRKIDGLPSGHSDLAGVRHSDGKAVYIEVKADKGKATPEQLKFIERMKSLGAIAGVCRSAEEALNLIGANNDI